MESRQLGFGSHLLLVVGSMVGSGILILPGLMLKNLPAPWLVLLALVVGGALTIAACFVFAELAAMMPRSGGQVHYLARGLGRAGRAASVAYGSSMFGLVLTGLAAAIAAAFAQFVHAFIPLPGAATPLVLGSWDTGLVLPPWGEACVAVAAIAVLAWLNARGIISGARLSNLATPLKVAGLLALAAILWFGATHPIALGTVGPATAPDGQLHLAAGFAIAVAFALFSYDGWVQATFVAGEVRDPQRTVPRVLLVAPLLVLVLYLLITAAFLRVVPAGEIGSDGLIAVTAAQHVLGDTGAKVVAGVALVAVLGTLNAFVLGVPRVFQEMGKKGILFPQMARSNARGVPSTAILYTSLWACLLVLTGVYAKLVYLVTFTVWLFYGLTAVAFLRLRRLEPDAPRPFRVRAGLTVATLFVVCSLYVVVSLIGNPDSRAYAGLSLVVIGGSSLLHVALSRRGPAPAAAPSRDARPGQRT